MRQAAEDWMTVRQAAEGLGVSQPLMRLEIGRGRVPASWLGEKHALVPRGWFEITRASHTADGPWDGRAKVRWDAALAEWEAAQ